MFPIKPCAIKAATARALIRLFVRRASSFLYPQASRHARPPVESFYFALKRRACERRVDEK